MGIYGSIERDGEQEVRAISMDSGGKGYYGDGDPDLRIDVSHARGWHDRIRLRLDWIAADPRQEPVLELLLPRDEVRRLIGYLQQAVEYVDPYAEPTSST
jgi:hypothetical protein